MRGNSNPKLLPLIFLHNENGMPMGMQIIGKKFDDLKLLAFAKRYEEIFKYSKIKPKFNN